MKTFIFGLVLLSSVSSFAYNCEVELAKNTSLTETAARMTEVTEAQRSLHLEMTSVARQAIELSCGLREAKQVHPLEEIEKIRHQILEMEGITEEQRSIFLEMNLNAKIAVELSI